MRRLVVTVICIISISRAYADEGMWLPMLLGQQTYNDMVKKGLKRRSHLSCVCRVPNLCRSTIQLQDS